VELDINFLIIIAFVAGMLLSAITALMVFFYVKQRQITLDQNYDPGIDSQDLQKFYDSLNFRRAGVKYTPADKYKDFRSVFLKDNDGGQGRRVLSQIISECEGLLIFEKDADSPGKLAFAAGKRSVGQWIIKAMHAKPTIDN